MARNDFPHPPVGTLLTGHFRVKRGVHCRRDHGTPDWLLFMTLAGRVRVGYGSGAFISTPGELVLIRPNVFHDYGTDPTAGCWEPVWTHFIPRPHWLEWLFWPEESSGYMRLAPSDLAMRKKIAVKFKEVHALATGSARKRDLLAMNALETLLLWCDAINPGSEQHEQDPRLRKALNFLSEHLGRKVSLSQIAASAGLSVSHLERLFRKELRTSPRRFLEQERIARAQLLLKMTSLSVQAIAWDVGFENPFYFTLRFKHHTGFGPRAYRKCTANQKQN